MKCTPWSHGLSGGPIKCHRNDVVVGHMVTEENKYPFCPNCDGVCQALVYLGILEICPDFDILVKFLEKLERNICDFELADYLPRDEGIE